MGHGGLLGAQGLRDSQRLERVGILKCVPGCKSGLPYWLTSEGSVVTNSLADWQSEFTEENFTFLSQYFLSVSCISL